MDRKNKSAARYVIGYHAVEEYLRKSAGNAVLHVALKNKRTRELAETARRAGVAVRYTDEGSLDSLPLAGNHRGLVLELLSPPQTLYTHLEEFISSFDAECGLVLVLDGVTDVHNLGALLRSADLLTADAVILPARGSAKEGETVAKISSGASAFVSVLEVPNLVRALAELKKAGFWIYGADMKGRPAGETDLNGRTALVLGSEGKGLSRLVEENCDALVRIPSAGHVDSFNVSVAGGILMYEVRRQQNFPGFAMS